VAHTFPKASISTEAAHQAIAAAEAKATSLSSYEYMRTRGRPAG